MFLRDIQAKSGMVGNYDCFGEDRVHHGYGENLIVLCGDSMHRSLVERMGQWLQ